MGQAAYYFFICYQIWYQQGNYLGRRSDSCRRRRSVGILVAPHPMTKCGDHFFVGRNRFDRLLGCFSFLLILGVRWSFLRLRLRFCIAKKSKVKARKKEWKKRIIQLYYLNLNNPFLRRLSNISLSAIWLRRREFSHLKYVVLLTTSS